MKTELCILVCVLAISNAWFLRQHKVVNSEGEISSECQSHASEGRCEFYSCFEQRFPCRTRGYMMRYGLHYCNRFADEDNFRHEFNPPGKQFLLASSRCITQKIERQFYSSNQINCHDVEHAAFQYMGECYLENNFCDIFWHNKDAFFRVFDTSDLFDGSSLKIWKEIGKLTLRCGTNTASNLFSYISSRARALREEHFN